MSAVQVNNEKGETLTKLKAGLTIAEALKRIRYTGFLEDEDGVACGDDDRITSDGAPYVSKQLQQQSKDELEDYDAAATSKVQSQV